MEKKYVPIINGFSSTENFGPRASPGSFDASAVPQAEPTGACQFGPWSCEHFAPGSPGQIGIAPRQTMGWTSSGIREIPSERFESARA